MPLSAGQYVIPHVSADGSIVALPFKRNPATSSLVVPVRSADGKVMVAGLQALGTWAQTGIPTRTADGHIAGLGPNLICQTCTWRDTYFIKMNATVVADPGWNASVLAQYNFILTNYFNVWHTVRFTSAWPLRGDCEWRDYTDDPTVAVFPKDVVYPCSFGPTNPCCSHGAGITMWYNDSADRLVFRWAWKQGGLCSSGGADISWEDLVLDNSGTTRVQGSFDYSLPGDSDCEEGPVGVRTPGDHVAWTNQWKSGAYGIAISSVEIA